MSKKIYSIISIIISIMLIFSLQNEVYASSATITASATKVEPSKSVTLTANIKSAASWALDVSVTGGTLKKNDSRVGNTDSGNNEDKTVALGTFTAETAGTYKITLSGYVVVVDGETFSKININDSISIVVEAPTPDREPETPSTTTPEPETPPATVTKSSEARLKNFGIKPKEYDFSGFKKDKTEGYSVEVPNEVESVEVYAEPVDSKAKVSGAGKVTLNEGNNTIGVTVTAEDGKTKKTYKLSIKRKTATEQVAEENAKNGENRLKSLSIKPKEFDFSGFNSEKTEYTAEVPNEIKEIEVIATAIDSKAQITGTGMIDLEEGKNELKIEVIAVNGELRTYTLTVTRKEAEEIESFGLSNLTIAGITLKPSFNVGTYEYTVESEQDIDALDIKAKANDEDATIEIARSENVITILVTNKETKEVVTYQINVNKKMAVVEEEKEQMSWLKPSTWGHEEYIKIAIIIVLIILIICAIALKINISKEGKNAKIVDFPGAEELDKAMAEHQELSDETNNPPEMFAPVNSEINNSEEFNINIDTNNYIEEIARDRLVVKDYEEKTKRKGRHF